MQPILGQDQFRKISVEINLIGFSWISVKADFALYDQILATADSAKNSHISAKAYLVKIWSGLTQLNSSIGVDPVEYEQISSDRLDWIRQNFSLNRLNWIRHNFVWVWRGRIRLNLGSGRLDQILVKDNSTEFDRVLVRVDSVEYNQISVTINLAERAKFCPGLTWLKMTKFGI